MFIVLIISIIATYAFFDKSIFYIIIFICYLIKTLSLFSSWSESIITILLIIWFFEWKILGVWWIHIFWLYFDYIPISFSEGSKSIKPSNKVKIFFLKGCFFYNIEFRIISSKWRRCLITRIEYIFSITRGTVFTKKSSKKWTPIYLKIVFWCYQSTCKSLSIFLVI